MRVCLPGFTLIVLAAFTSSGCGIEGGDYQPCVPDQGLLISAEANRHEAEDTADVVAALFNDGEAVDLRWMAGVGDRMRMLAAVECTDGLATSSYGVVADREVEAGVDFDGYIFIFQLR